MTTRDRIMGKLAELASEEQTSGFGEMVAGLYALGLHGAIADALPENDADADALLEDFAGLVLELRSDPARVARPFEPTAEQIATADAAPDSGELEVDAYAAEHEPAAAEFSDA